MTPLFRAALPLALFLAATALPAAEPSSAPLLYFRSDKGRQSGTGHLPESLDAPENLRWRVEVDPGHSTLILHGSRIFLTSFRIESKELEVMVLDEATGRMLWRKPIVPGRLEETHPIGNPATATPACDGVRLFVFFGSAGLFCYDLEGTKLWEQRMGPFRDEYGAGSSPILLDDKVIINQDHDTDSFLAAYDRSTGRQLWKISRPDAVRSYSTPTVWNRAGKPEILVAGALQLNAYDPAKGDRLWWVNGLARIVIPTPAISGEMIYMASWSPGGDAGKRLELDPWATAVGKWDSDHNGKLSKSEIDDREVLDRFNR